MSKYLLFDIGGTKTRISVSYDGQGIGEPNVYPTPQSYQEGLNEIAKIAQSLSSDGFEAAGGGIAGPLNKDKSGIINAPNIPDWNGKKLKEDLESILHTTVLLENDTALVGLGEAVNGRGKDYAIVVYITVSTGVNGVRVVNKRLDEHYFGFEIGKQIIEVETGTSWEDMLAHDGETPEKEAELVATGVFNSVLFWSPEIIILGGGRMKSVDIELVKKHLNRVLKVYPELPLVERAQLGDIGGLYGALSFLKEK